jgi:AraC-like DNA-binding protein
MLSKLVNQITRQGNMDKISLMMKKKTITRLMCWYLFLFTPILSVAQISFTQRYEALKKMVSEKPAEAARVAHQLMEEAIIQQNDTIEVKAKYQLGLAYYFDNKLLLAAKYLQEALQSSYAANQDDFRENCWNNLGIVYDKQNRKTQALEAFYQSIRLAEAKGDSASMMMTYINVFILDRRNYQIDKAIRGFHYAIDFFNRQQDTLNAAICHHNLSSIYLDRKQTDLFTYHIDKAIKGYEHSDEKLGYAYILLNKAQGFALLKDYDQAEKTIAIANKLCASNNFLDVSAYLKTLSINMSIARGDNLGQLPDQFAQLKPYTDTSDVFLADNIRRSKLRFYARTGQFKAFETAFEEFITLQEQENETSKKGILEEIEAIYTLDKLQQEKTILKENLQEQRHWIISLLGISALLSMLFTIILVLYYRLQFRTKALFRINNELAFSSPAVPLEQEVSEDLSEDKDIPLSNLYQIIIQKLEKDKPYLDPNFNLPLFSQMINRSERYVSLAINKVGNNNFNKLITHYRINEARRLIAVHGAQIPLNEIAEKSGFSNRVSFYRNFKDETGLSPKEYVDQAISDRELFKQDKTPI